MTHSSTVDPQQQRAGRLLLIACIISFVCFFGSYMRIPVVPLFAASLGADSVQVGFINAAFMLMAGALSIPSGIVSDRLGRRVPLLAGMLLLSGSSFLLHWCRTPFQMGAVYLLFGVGLSAFSPTLMSYVADVTPAHLLGQAYGWYTMAVYGGMTVGPAAGGFLGKVLGLSQVFPVAGALILAMCLVAAFLLPPPPVQESRERQRFLPALAALRVNRPFLACQLATLGTCFGFGMFVTFMPLYIRSQGMHAGQVGLVFGAQALANALSRLPSGRYSDRVADRSILVKFGLLFFAVAVAGFAVCRGVAPLMVSAGFMGVSMGVAFTAIGALIADSVPREQRGLAMGCYNTCVYFGMMLSATVMGGVVKHAGYPVAFFATGAVGAVVLVFFCILFKRDRAVAVGGVEVGTIE